MTGSAEETGDHLLRCASFTNNFGCIWLVLKDPYTGFSYADIMKCLRCILNEFPQHFLLPTNTSLLVSISQEMRYPSRINLFHMSYLGLFLAIYHRCFLSQQPMLDDLHGVCPGVNSLKEFFWCWRKALHYAIKFNCASCRVRPRWKLWKNHCKEMFTSLFHFHLKSISHHGVTYTNNTEMTNCVVWGYVSQCGICAGTY